MLEFIAGILMIGLFVWIAKGTEWRSCNRSIPPGCDHDWDTATVDIALHGKDYYHQQNLKGKYDIPKKK